MDISNTETAHMQELVNEQDGWIKETYIETSSVVPVTEADLLMSESGSGDTSSDSDE